MNFRQLSEVQAHLQTIADQVGAKRFASAKAAYLNNVVVTDDTGAPMAPGTYSIDVVIPEDAPMSDGMSGDEDMPKGANLADAVRKAVRSELDRTKATTATKAPVITAGDSPRFTAYGKAVRLKRARPHISQAQCNEDAYRTGKWVQAVLGSASAREWCERHGLPIRKGRLDGMDIKGHTEDNNALGGFLVPDEIDNNMIDLREEYGVFRRNAYRGVMSRDTLSRRRRKGGLTAYAVGEAAAGTESTKEWDLVELVAKKWIVLTTISNELNEDATISLGDDFASEVAFAFAEKEDLCGFTGTGSSAFHGIVGLQQAFTNLGTVGNSASVVDGTGSTWSSLVLADFNALTGKILVRARRNAKWYCSSQFYAEVMERLAYASGGVTVTDIKDGAPQQSFLGYPVELSEVLPNASATGFPCFFGDLTLAAMFGDRRGTTIAFSDSALNAFEQDEIAARGTTRFDIVVHDVGNNNATAANRKRGPIGALYIG
jgi:HK97 family phage major capsid protein